MSAEAADLSVDQYPALLQRIRAGDSDAEHLLVRRFGPGVRAMLRQWTRDPAVADDVFQDTFTLVLTKARRDEIRNPLALGAFIRAAAHNLLIADRRKEARYTTFDEPADTAPSSPSGDAVERLVREEEARQVRRLLTELRHDRDRQLLIRYYLGDEGSADICNDLGIDPARLNRALFRARRRLRELWEHAESRRTLLGDAARDVTRSSGADLLVLGWILFGTFSLLTALLQWVRP